MNRHEIQTIYIISGCNGAGKTTASFTILPEILNIDEFINADEIARGISPFNPESVSIEAGRLMLARIKRLIDQRESFALETTLATRSYVSLLNQARTQGYQTIGLFFWLDSVNLAIERVKKRVQTGGHSIPTDIIMRRYYRGLENFFGIYSNSFDEWILVNNSGSSFEIVAKKKNQILTILKNKVWNQISSPYAKNNG